MMSLDDLNSIKAERHIYSASKKEALQDYLDVKQKVEAAEKEKEYALSQLNDAKSEYFEIRGKYMQAKQETKESLQEEYLIAQEIRDLQKQRFKEADEKVNRLYLEKQVKWEIYSYFKWEAERLSEIIQNNYKELWKTPKNKRKLPK